MSAPDTVTATEGEDRLRLPDLSQLKETSCNNIVDGNDLNHIKF